MFEQKETESVKLPLFLRLGDSTPSNVVTIDKDLEGELGRYKWLLDANAGTAYRTLKLGDDKRVGKEYLHRRVMGITAIGGGKVVKFKSSAKLDCRRKNLVLDGTRKFKNYETSKLFPVNPRAYSKYIEKYHAGTPYEEFLQNVVITAYGKRRIAFELDEGLTEASPSTLTKVMQEFFEQEFGYKGEVLVVLNRKSPLPATVTPANVTPAKALTSAPVLPPAPPAPLAAVKGDALAFLQNLGGVFGVSTAKETSLDFCTFGVRQGDEILKFSFVREKISPETRISG